MTRRRFAMIVPVLPWMAHGTTVSARGRVRLEGEGRPVLVGSDGSSTALRGDRETLAVLRDARLRGDELELRGRAEGGKFEIDPIHTRAVFIWRGGKRLVVTYWCGICSIRAWTPGKCQCCQEEMDLDPRDPGLKDTDPSH
jgi:hypothetical protein